MNKTQLGLTTVLMTVPLLNTSAFADPGTSFDGHHMGFGGWFLGPIMMILIIALTVMALVFVLRWMGIGGDFNRPRDSALDILNERFARGEIDKSEFDERRRALTG